MLFLHHMILELVIIGKTCRAVGALIRFFTRVATHMCFQSELCDASVRTDATLVLLLARMDALMNEKAMVPLECQAAHVALVWPFICVRSHVLRQDTRVPGDVRTELTSVSLWTADLS